MAAEERYEFIARTVRRFGDVRLKRGDKAVVLRFLERVSGYSRQQLTRLVKRGCQRGRLRSNRRKTRYARLRDKGQRWASWENMRSARERPPLLGGEHATELST